MKREPLTTFGMLAIGQRVVLKGRPQPRGTIVRLSPSLELALVLFDHPPHSRLRRVWHRPSQLVLLS